MSEIKPTVSSLIKRVEELEKRLLLLETQRLIINVYPPTPITYQQNPSPVYPYWTTPGSTCGGGTSPSNFTTPPNNITLC